MLEPIQIELPTFFEAMTVNAWLLKGTENVLIDCGEKTDKCWAALNKGLEANGLTIQDISKVVITHAHLDHMGMANKITQHCDATIWVSEMTYDWAINLKELLDRRSDAIMAAFNSNLKKDQLKSVFAFGYELLSPFWEEIPKERVKTFPMTGSIDIAGNSWEIVHTPGHCLNQTCFYQREKGWLLSADMILPMIHIPIKDAERTPPYKGVKSLMMHYDSYDKLEQLSITKAFPGHYEVIENVPQLIIKQKNRIQQRKEKCSQYIQEGMTTFMELVEAIYPDRINNATMFMVLGFLEMLKAEGRIRVDVIDGLKTYAPIKDIAFIS